MFLLISTRNYLKQISPRNTTNGPDLYQWVGKFYDKLIFLIQIIALLIYKKYNIIFLILKNN